MENAGIRKMKETHERMGIPNIPRTVALLSISLIMAI